jgi:hypothetical protein
LDQDVVEWSGEEGGGVRTGEEHRVEHRARRRRKRRVDFWVSDNTRRGVPCVKAGRGGGGGGGARRTRGKGRRERKEGWGRQDEG